MVTRCLRPLMGCQRRVRAEMALDASAEVAAGSSARCVAANPLVALKKRLLRDWGDRIARYFCFLERPGARRRTGWAWSRVTKSGLQSASRKLSPPVAGGAVPSLPAPCDACFHRRVHASSLPSFCKAQRIRQPTARKAIRAGRAFIPSLLFNVDAPAKSKCWRLLLRRLSASAAGLPRESPGIHIRDCYQT